MHSLAEKMYSNLQRLNRNSETPIEPDDDKEIIAKLEYVQLLTKNIAGCTLTKLGEAAILGDLNSFVKFYQRLVLQDFSLSREIQNPKKDR